MQYSHGRRPARASPHILTALLKAGTIRVVYYNYQYLIFIFIIYCYHVLIIYYCLVLIGLLYKAYCQRRFTNPAEAKAPALPHEGASALVKADTILTLTAHVRLSFTLQLL